jgi:hypothetical protein
VYNVQRQRVFSPENSKQIVIEALAIHPLKEKFTGFILNQQIIAVYGVFNLGAPNYAK